MVFILYIDVGEEECKQTLKNNGFDVGYVGIIEDDGSQAIVPTINIDSLTDIKNIQAVLNNNPYPVESITFNFDKYNNDGNQLFPTMFIDND